MKRKTQKRNGYNIIELLVVIAAISLITAIAYKGVNILFDNIKTEGVKTEFSKIKTAIAKSQAVGNIYWGGNIEGMNGTDLKTGMSFLSPYKAPSESASGTCNYNTLSSDGSAFVNNCDHTNIIYAEKELFSQMVKLGFKYVGTQTGNGADGTPPDGTFRSSQFPSAQIGFLPNLNGYAGIVMTDIPGTIARRMYEDINKPTWDPTKDGLSNNRPLMIFPGGNIIYNTDTTLPLPDSGLSTLFDKTFSDDNSSSVPVLDKIDKLPKVTVVYIYSYRNVSWN